jgi:hypothetical protein
MRRRDFFGRFALGLGGATLTELFDSQVPAAGAEGVADVRSD